MIDTFGRKIDYLRLSITDRCNYRCRYCTPEGDPPERADLLSAAEYIEIVRAAAACGITKVRVTGGEPLIHPEILTLCRGIRKIPGIAELCLTTNGCYLPRLAVPLREAGVTRLNISLDTLRPDRFAAMTRCGSLSEALGGIAAAGKAGFADLKLNTVLIGGFNEDEIGDFLALTEENLWEVRFIELMPMRPCARWEKERFLSNAEVLSRFPALQPVDTRGVARRYRLPGAKGTVGLISPMSHDFCGACRRIRVTADGRLKSCLHSREELPLRGIHGEDLERTIRQGILSKPGQHHLNERPSDTARTMNQIGG